MIDKVRKISKNPITAIQEFENDLFLQDQEGMSKSDVNLETKFLENSIYRIGALLVLGYGEAGSEIITQNMNKDGLLNPIIEGKKIYGI